MELISACFYLFLQRRALREGEVVHAGRAVAADHGGGLRLQRAARHHPRQHRRAAEDAAQERLHARQGAHHEDQRHPRGVHPGLLQPGRQQE